jgi:hypothetical protein
VEGYVISFEFRKMISCRHLYISFLSILFLCGCGAQLALSGQVREDYLKSIKAYGEYFVKPGASQEEWQRDWITCGGWPNGQFSGGAPDGSPTNEIFAAIDKARNSLDACMKSKGYEYRETQ